MHRVQQRSGPMSSSGTEQLTDVALGCSTFEHGSGQHIHNYRWNWLLLKKDEEFERNQHIVLDADSKELGRIARLL